MMTRNRTRTVSTLAAVVMAILVLPAAAGIPAQLPDPGGKAPDTTKPVKVYILAGQSNMVGMGKIAGDKPGTLETVVKKEKKFQHLVDDNGNWTTRNDVFFCDLTNRKIARWLTVGVMGRTIGPEVQFGHIMGHYHDEMVLVIKAA